MKGNERNDNGCFEDKSHVKLSRDAEKGVGLKEVLPVGACHSAIQVERESDREKENRKEEEN